MKAEIIHQTEKTFQDGTKMYRLTLVDTSNPNAPAADLYSKERYEKGSIVNVDVRPYSTKDGTFLKAYIQKNK